MPLDPQARQVLDQLEAIGMPDFSTVDPATARQFTEAGIVPSDETVASVEDHSLPGPAGDIPVRVYAPASDQPLPMLLFFHGGGWVICNLDTHDGVCRALANAAGCVVVSVDYRLAPEHPYPTPAEDCYAATTWVAEHGATLGGDPTRLAVGGDSAGGNLAAVVALMARDRAGPHLLHQLLVYPVTDFAFDTASYTDNATGYMLSRDMMKWFWGHYLSREEDGRSPYASPLRARDVSGLPPAHVVTAQYDPLRDEGDAYAARLREAGVPTTHRCFDGMFHGFFNMGAALDAAREAVSEAAAELRSAFER